MLVRQGVAPERLCGALLWIFLLAHHTGLMLQFSSAGNLMTGLVLVRLHCKDSIRPVCVWVWMGVVCCVRVCARLKSWALRLYAGRAVRCAELVCFCSVCMVVFSSYPCVFVSPCPLSSGTFVFAHHTQLQAGGACWCQVVHIRSEWFCQPWACDAAHSANMCKRRWFAVTTHGCCAGLGAQVSQGLGSALQNPTWCSHVSLWRSIVAQALNVDVQPVARGGRRGVLLEEVALGARGGGGGVI
jgi:hypothetical protein